jgi:hypothetical protein
MLCHRRRVDAGERSEGRFIAESSCVMPHDRREGRAQSEPA